MDDYACVFIAKNQEGQSMNIMFCLTPKSEVDYVTEEASLYKAVQKIEEHKYTSIPLISKTGKYIGTITSGDLLGALVKNFEVSVSVRDAQNFPITKVKRTRDNKPVRANAHMEDIVEAVMMQNFVPVIDDEENFIGIITRREILKYLQSKIDKLSEQEDV